MVCKEKYQDNLVIFEKLIDFNQCDLNFKSLGDLIKVVSHSLIQLNINDWKNRTCTCKYFSKKYFCSHIIVVAVGLRLVTIPEYCKNVNIGNLKKRGRVSNALRGTPLKTQPNVI